MPSRTRSRNDPPFDRSNPLTYPNRFSIRVPGPLDYSLTSHVGELYAQDKWQVKPNLTLSLGVRYDNPLFSRTMGSETKGLDALSRLLSTPSKNTAPTG